MIYTPHNTSLAGRPVKVMVNGYLVDDAIFADTERGIVRYCPQPVRVKKGADYVYTRVLRGVVTVEDY